MNNRHPLIAVLTVCALGAAACGDSQSGEIETADTQETDDTEETASNQGEGDGLDADLLGAGASFPDPVYQTWIGEYTGNVEPGVSIQYESIGSGGGRENFIAQETDFAGSDAFMSDEEIAAAIDERGCGDVLHIPMVFGGVAIAHNLDGVADGELVLDAPTAADMFSGEITEWSDEAIAELNPDLDLPDEEIVPNVRADGSGTTQTFSLWLADEDEDWADDYGSGDEVDWFDGVVASEQNDGVAGAMEQQPGSVGYLSLEFAVQARLPTASVVNSDGNAVEPSTETVAQATDGIDLPEDLRFDILGVGERGYPIATATWVLAYTCGMEGDKAEALRHFLTWAVEEGGSFAEDLGYAPLAGTAEEASLDKIEQINADDE